MKYVANHCIGYLQSWWKFLRIQYLNSWNTILFSAWSVKTPSVEAFPLLTPSPPPLYEYVLEVFQRTHAQLQRRRKDQLHLICIEYATISEVQQSYNNFGPNVTHAVLFKETCVAKHTFLQYGERTREVLQQYNFCGETFESSLTLHVTAFGRESYASNVNGADIKLRAYRQCKITIITIFKGIKDPLGFRLTFKPTTSSILVLKCVTSSR